MAWVREELSDVVVPGSRGRPATFSETVVNDQDKSLAIIDEINGRALLVTGIRAEIATDATVGTRNIEVELQSSAGDVVYNAVASGTVTASSTLNLEWSPGGAEHLPDAFVAHDGQTLRIFLSGVVGSADDVVLHIRGVQL